jgi:hypothetical protein
MPAFAEEMAAIAAALRAAAHTNSIHADDVYSRELLGVRRGRVARHR